MATNINYTVSGLTAPLVVGDLNSNVGTITGDGGAYGGTFGSGLNTLDESHDWNGGSATVSGATLEIDHSANGIAVGLSNATLLLNGDANGAAVNFLSGESEVVFGTGAHVAQSNNLGNMSFTNMVAGDLLFFQGSTSNGAGTPTYNAATHMLSFSINGTNYSVNVTGDTHFAYGSNANGHYVIATTCILGLSGHS
jgi:hypothetical protein